MLEQTFEIVLVCTPKSQCPTLRCRGAARGRGKAVWVVVWFVMRLLPSRVVPTNISNGHVHERMNRRTDEQNHACYAVHPPPQPMGGIGAYVGHGSRHRFWFRRTYLTTPHPPFFFLFGPGRPAMANSNPARNAAGALHRRLSQCTRWCDGSPAPPNNFQERPQQPAHIVYNVQSMAEVRSV